MFRNLILVACALSVAILVGCSKTETTTENTNRASTTAATPAAATPAAGTAATAPAGEKIGVPECDDFIAKYEACVSSKVPEVARASFETAVKQWRQSWKQLAENPQTKGTLVEACKQAKAQQETALKPYGCAW